MNQKTRIILGILFLIITVIVVSVIRINPNNVTPIQSTESKHARILLGLGKGIALNQGITAVKDYLAGVELVFTQGGRNNTNQNTLLVLDTLYNILYKQTFSSSILKEGDYNLFDFAKPVHIGKGNRFYVSLFSINGSEDNSASPLFNLNDSIGVFYTSELNSDDVIGSLKIKLAQYHGSLMLKTYETNYSQSWLLKIFLYILIVVIAALIVWSDKLSRYLSNFHIRPEFAYLGISIPFSLIFTFINPPFQVPDEVTHFNHSYNISEFGFLDKQKSVPSSINKMESVFSHLHFRAGQKTSMAEIQGQSHVKIEPEKRIPFSFSEYTLPYIPQAIGISIGKLFSSSLLTVMYFGRIFNFLISALIIFFAIKLIPHPFRLLFLLLALMPKTLFLFGSLSYDSLTISLSFFTIALFFYYAFTCERKLTVMDLALMALSVLMLLLCKPPYFMLGALFFIIPHVKFGKLYKFILIAIGVIVIGIVFFKVIPTVNGYMDKIKESDNSVIISSTGNLDNTLTAGDSIAKSRTVFMPEKQIKTILSDIPAYLKLIFNSGFVYYRDYILESFVGVLGYIDVDLPDMLTYSYLLLMLLAAMVISDEKIRLGISRKTLFFILVALTFILIETAMFLFATRPGRDRVFGVQGRYFIPMAPLFFMMFYNRFLNPKLNLLFSLSRQEYQNAKPKLKPAVLDEIQGKERLFDKYLYFSAILYCIFALVYAVYLTLIRYYV